MTDQKNDLVPLSPEAAEEFQRRRESDAVVQTKCETCGAWWETRKKDYPFQEMFTCDCGVFMSFPVPAMPKVITPTNEHILALGDRDEKLDSGMSVKEALKNAEAWWRRIGQKEAKLHAMRQQNQVGHVNRGIGGRFADEDPNSENYMPSGIIHGYDWEALSKREKLMVTKAWHHFHVRNPDVLGEDGEAEFKMQERGKIQ